MGVPNPTLIPGVEQIKDFEGQELGKSDWVAITQERIDTFAEAT
jgi:acyl dehydratase